MKAFPTDRLGVIAETRDISINQTQQDGMDLRDYFAAKAMQGMLTNQPLRVDVMLNGDSLAQSSYQIADAMMKARNNVT